MESGGWALGALRREEGAITGYRPLPGSGVLSQGQPFPGIYSLFIGTEEKSAWVGQGLLFSLPCLSWQVHPTLPP